MNSLLIFGLLMATFLAVNARPMENKHHLVGGVATIEDEAEHNEVVELLKQHIGKLEEGSWEIVEITKTGRQIVGGVKYYLYGTFKDSKNGSRYSATVTIYTRPWEDYFEVKMQDKEMVQ